MCTRATPVAETLLRPFVGTRIDRLLLDQYHARLLTHGASARVG